MNSQRLLILVLWLFPLIAVQSAVARQWKDKTGRFKAEAVFVRMNGDQVVLRNANGLERRVPWKRLSDADKKYLASLATPREKDGHEILKMDFRTLTTQEAKEALQQVREGLVDEGFLQVLNKHLEFVVKSRTGRIPPRSPAVVVQHQPHQNVPVPHADILDSIDTFLKENSNDPRKLEIVAIGKPMDLRRAYMWTGGNSAIDRHVKELGRVGKHLWESIGIDGIAVPVKYRGTNMLGALVLNKRIFFIRDGQVIGGIKPNDFLPQCPVTRPDPNLEEFLKLGRQ